MKSQNTKGQKEQNIVLSLGEWSIILAFTSFFYGTMEFEPRAYYRVGNWIIISSVVGLFLNA